MRKLTTLFFLLIFLLFSTVTPALANPYGPHNGAASVSSTQVFSGDQVTVSGDGFCPGTSVAFTVTQADDTYIHGHIRVKSDGHVSTVITLTEVGNNRIFLEGEQRGCNAFTLTLKAHVNVVSEIITSAKVKGHALPHTGADLTSLYAGAGLLAAGSILILVARKRHHIMLQ